MVAEKLKVCRLEELLARIREDDAAAVHQEVFLLPLLLPLGAVRHVDVLAHRGCDPPRSSAMVCM